ncbi:MAG: helix-turn-helix transcriptional regulator [Bacilli bacterium]|nr:helix-turn-helix transcriptional regulator [Bacilli bacterium]
MKGLSIEEQLGKRIRYLRKLKKKSIEDLALDSNINKNYLGDLENGRRNPTLKMLEKIANGLGITISELTKGLESLEI